MEKKKIDSLKKPSSMARLRNYFLTGFVICAPVIITIYLTWTIIKWVDSWVLPYVPSTYLPDTYLAFDIPGFGLVVALFLITTIGFLTANLVGKSIVAFGERQLARMPVVRNLYSALKQIFETVFRENSESFQKVALVEYPRPGIWALAFVATDTLGEVQAALDEPAGKTVSVFLPTTPNPTSGFLLFVPANDLLVLDMSVEEAAKLVISAGLVAPEFASAKESALHKREAIKASAAKPTVKTKSSGA